MAKAEDEGACKCSDAPQPSELDCQAQFWLKHLAERAQQQLSWGGLAKEACEMSEPQAGRTAAGCPRWRGRGVVTALGVQLGKPSLRAVPAVRVMGPGPLPPSMFLFHHTPLQALSSRNEEVPPRSAGPARVSEKRQKVGRGGSGHRSALGECSWRRGPS